MRLLLLRKKLSTTLVKHSTPLLTLPRKLPPTLLTLLLSTMQVLSLKAQWTMLLLSTTLLKQPKKRRRNRLWLTAT